MSHTIGLEGVGLEDVSQVGQKDLKEAVEDFEDADEGSRDSGKGGVTQVRLKNNYKILCITLNVRL